mmetsp:Transcript_54174/g.85815  ORF Transcript_54174/g.85815 Transcript_54174/m.85815 type:complete len:101 (+) Transcript_54174:285-587(+)
MVSSGVRGCLLMLDYSLDMEVEQAVKIRYRCRAGGNIAEATFRCVKQTNRRPLAPVELLSSRLEVVSVIECQLGYRMVAAEVCRHKLHHYWLLRTQCPRV